MAHLSLYRQYRPDSFDKMVRQEHVVRVLKNQIEKKTVGHAYLFTGPRGTGKTSVARIFARAVNCEKPENGSPCGTCKVCRALLDGSLDISEIDAASNNGVNEMRDLRDKVQYPPVSGKYKVYIIDEVHMLTDSAFNALLKTLEEPPRHAMFILATTEPQKLPATILSRCMRLDFKLIPTEDLVKHLKSILKEMGTAYEDEAVEAIARAGAGSDRDMLSIAEMCLAYADKLTYDGVTSVLGAADFKETCTLAGQLVAPDLSSALTTAEKILSAGRSVGVLCRDVLQALNMIAIAKACSNAESLLMIPKEHFRLVSKIAEVADSRSILRVTDIFVRLEPELRYATSPRISFETAVMRAALPNADLDLDALAVRVAGVEKRLSEGVTLLDAVQIPKPIPKGQINSEVLKSEVREEESPFDAGDFPMEEPIFDCEEPPADEMKKAEKVEKEKKNSPKPQELILPLPKNASAETVFGKFMRALRKTGSNGVLYTMCSDLEFFFEGETLILTTESDTIYRALIRDDHTKTMKEVFGSLGFVYEVRQKGAKIETKHGIGELEQNFSDYTVQVKEK